MTTNIFSSIAMNDYSSIITRENNNSLAVIMLLCNKEAAIAFATNQKFEFGEIITYNGAAYIIAEIQIKGDYMNCVAYGINSFYDIIKCTDGENEFGEKIEIQEIVYSNVQAYSQKHLQPDSSTKIGLFSQSYLEIVMPAKYIENAENKLKTLDLISDGYLKNTYKIESADILKTKIQNADNRIGLITLLCTISNY